jgi:hypothetical protein
MGAAFPWTRGFGHAVTERLLSYGLRPFDFSFAAASLATDDTAMTGRKPVPFTVMRRVNVPFDANIYFSTAPLKTNDHIAALETFERNFS